MIEAEGELVGDGAGDRVVLAVGVLVAGGVAELVVSELAETVGLPVLGPLGVGVSVKAGERRLAMLRLRMVALATPASLDSHEYADRSAPLAAKLLGTSAVTLV